MRPLLAFVAGIAVGATGAVAGGLVWGSGSTPPVRGGGELSALPVGPVTVRAGTVRLPKGFESRHRHGGPTFNVVRSGRVFIADARGRRPYGPGDMFFEPGGLVHTITVLEDARIDVIRVLPLGAAETTEVG